MSKLENIVPPLELCKKIPAGEFEDSVLVWKERIGISCDDLVKIREPEDISYKVESAEVNYFPAPTLEETITSLLTYGWLVKIDCRFGLDTFVELYSRTSNKHYTEYDPSACAAALRLWFKVKGIEVE